MDSSISNISFMVSSASFRLRGIWEYKYRPTKPDRVTASMLQKAIPAIFPNLKVEWNAIMIGAVVPSTTWKSSQCREFPCRPSQPHFFRKGYR